MTIEIIDSDGQREQSEPSFPEVVRETTNEGQVIWLTSSPEKKSPEASDHS